MQRLNSIILIIFLAAAAYYDLKQNKIPNRITFPMIVWGIISMSMIGGMKGLQTSLFGFLLGFVIFFVPFTFHAMGGGDVKLMAGIGAMLGWQMIISVILYAAICGGIVVLIMAIYQKRLLAVLLSAFGVLLNPILKWIYRKTNHKVMFQLSQQISSFSVEKEKKYIPYGVAIALGTLLVISGSVPLVL